MTKLPTGEDETDRVLVDLAAEAFKNARNLLASARAVRDGQQWPMAFSVAALALEEVGKAVLCTTMLAWPQAVREDFRPKFPKAFNSHEAKAFCAHLALQMVAEEVPEGLERLMEEAIEAASRTNAVKFRGLYVDYTAAGDILTPEDVTEEQAHQMIVIVEAVLDLSSDAEDAVAQPDVYIDVVRQVRTSEAYVALWDDLDESAGQVFTATRALVRDDVDPSQAFSGTPLAELISDVTTRGAVPADEGGQPAVP